MLFLLAKISIIIIFLSYMLWSFPIVPFFYSLIPKFIYLLWRNVFQIAIYYFHFFFGIMLRSDYIPKIIKIDQVLHPIFYLILYYIISYFLKKFTFINTEVEIATKNIKYSENSVGANSVRPSKQYTKSTTPTKSIVLLSYLNQSAILLAVILSYLNTAYLTADSLRQLVHELNYSRILVRSS